MIACLINKKRKAKVLARLRSELIEAVGMNQWRRASNICTRIERINPIKSHAD